MVIDICYFEPDEVLAGRLIDYWMAHGLDKYSVCHYSEEQLFLERFVTAQAKLWVLDKSIKERLPEVLPSNILWLSENPDATDAIFKYRSAAILLHTILDYIEVGKGKAMVESHTQLISLYTPIKCSSQTAFGITISHILSRKGRTLYLNLEGYSGFAEMLSGNYVKDISDFIYSFYHSKEKFPFYATNFIYRLGEVDMIPPVLNPINLQEISREMWVQMLTALLESAMYDYIVIDISDFVQGIFDILQMSQVVFSLAKSQEKAERKWQQYQMLLEGLGLEAVLQKSHKLIVPHGMAMPAKLEMYMPCAFSDYVENLLREVGVLLQ